VYLSPDFVVIGSGIAGLRAAIALAPMGRVLILTKAEPTESNTGYAQGGIAAAVGAGDDPAFHAEDTFAAGRGLCRPSAVRLLTEDAPARIADLAARGVEFDAGLAREGGHSRRRVVHAGGAQTGSCIADALALAVATEPRIEVAEGEGAIGLRLAGGRCAGVVTADREVPARATLLATGGYAALWERTTNPRGAVGDGLLLAYGAGAALADLELMQFHPTALIGNGFLLSEALRGDGALLLDEQGERFTDELAPRDVVARAIAAHDRAGLDLRPVALDRYPSLVATLERAGYHPADEPIPVAPAAHYSIGGIVTDLDGRSSVPGLYAAGECACTGVHGANRLASNSLLECVVLGRRAGLAALGEPGLPAAAAETVLAETAPPADEVRRALWREAGLIRSADGLERLLDAPHPLARLIARSALERRESRGVHFREDFPGESAECAHTVLRPGKEPVAERWS
jgi:L-aspartate oxidase